MHERTRRNLCRLAFLVMGVVPTVCTLAWAGYRISPIYVEVERADWEQRLTAMTGLTARLVRLEFPGGDSIVLHNLEFTDPDDGRVVVKIRQAEIDQRPEGIVIALSQPEVTQGKFLRLWDVLDLHILRGPALASAVQITTGELTLEVGERGQSFTSVICTLENVGSSLQASIGFQLAGVSMPAAAQLQIRRNRQVIPPVTSWSLATATPLPCALFADYLPPLTNLGDQALFQGKIYCNLPRDRVTAQWSGQLSQVDLDILSDPLPHKLTGWATIDIRQANLEQGVLTFLEGTLVSHGGTASRSFVASLAENVPLATPEVMQVGNTAPSLFHYDELGFQFSVSGEGCTLRGVPELPENVILIASGQPMLTVDSQTPYPLVSIVRALAPDTRYLVPATDATRSLLQFLDFPSPQPRTLQRDVQPPNRLRMSNGRRE